MSLGGFAGPMQMGAPTRPPKGRFPIAAVVRWDVERWPADASTIERLARAQLLARRRGYELRLRGVSAELRELIEFVGLADVLRD